MNKRIKVILIAVAIVIVSGGVTAAVIARVVPKDTNGDGSAKSEKSVKQQAADADAKAKALLNTTTKMGYGSATDKKTKEAAAQFEEASKLSKQAGDMNASNEAQANADALQSRLKAEEAAKTQYEAEQAKRKADFEAAKAAFAPSVH